MASQVGAKMMSIVEINGAVSNGVDDMRKLQDSCSMRPLGGGNSAYIIDEAHSLSKQAFQSLLKLFEDTPKHTYFFLCTSHPEKIDKAIKSRVTAISLKDVPLAGLKALVGNVASNEGITLPAGAVDTIAKSAGGSARVALVLLGQAISAKFDKDVMASMSLDVDEKSNHFPICSEVMWPKMSWETVYGHLDAIAEDEIEAVRWMLLRYAQACMSQGRNAARAAKVIQAMRTPFFDSKKAGFFANYYLAWSMK
jgi:DNA polymerase III delta prime subunit